MRNVTIFQGSTARKKFQTEDSCSLKLEGHTWSRVNFQGQAVAIVCVKCGRYPLEIMAMWDVVR